MEFGAHLNFFIMIIFLSIYLCSILYNVLSFLLVHLLATLNELSQQLFHILKLLIFK